MTTQINLSLKDIAVSLLRIANALEEANEIKHAGYNITLGGNNNADCYSKEELPLPTPWNSIVTPSCDGDCICGKNN
jgi:hypothetical protein